MPLRWEVTALFLRRITLCLVQGRGEILTDIEVSLRGKFLVLVKPDIHVSTAEAFAGIRPQQPEHSLHELLQRPISEWRLSLKNDFEESVFRKYPAIQGIKEKMYGLVRYTPA